MNTTEFRAAVEQIIGVPPEQAEPFHVWTIATEDFPARILIDDEVPCLQIKWSQFVPRKLERWGANGHDGTWHIWFRDFNHDPEAVLRELSRRLVRAGYSPPPVGTLILSDPDPKPGLRIWMSEGLPDNPAPGSMAFRISEPGFRWQLDGCKVSQVPMGDTGLTVTLTQDERSHLTALLETTVEPQENRPPGFVGSVWQGQQDAWASILEKLKP